MRLSLAFHYNLATIFFFVCVCVFFLLIYVDVVILRIFDLLSKLIRMCTDCTKFKFPGRIQASTMWPILGACSSSTSTRTVLTTARTLPAPPRTTHRRSPSMGTCSYQRTTTPPWWMHWSLRGRSLLRWMPPGGVHTSQVRYLYVTCYKFFLIANQRRQPSNSFRFFNCMRPFQLALDPFFYVFWYCTPTSF